MHDRGASDVQAMTEQLHHGLVAKTPAVEPKVERDGRTRGSARGYFNPGSCNGSNPVHKSPSLIEIPAQQVAWHHVTPQQ